MKCSHRFGFTLVEIISVVAILSILMAVSIPAMLAYRKTAHAKACSDNMHLIRGAIRAYEVKTGKLETDLDKLVGSEGTGFLKWKPVCPVGGEYEISVDQGTEAITITCTQADKENHDVADQTP